MSPIQSVIEILGSQAELARCCTVSPQAVTQWVKHRNRVPASRCLLIEKATKGKVTRYQLRPDVFGDCADAYQCGSAAVDAESTPETEKTGS